MVETSTTDDSLLFDTITKNSPNMYFNKNMRKFWGAKEYLGNLGLARLEKEQPASFTVEVDYDNRLVPGIFVHILGFGDFSGIAYLQKVNTYINFRDGIKQRLTMIIEEMLEIDDVDIKITDIPQNYHMPPPRPHGYSRNVPNETPPPGSPCRRIVTTCDTNTMRTWNEYYEKAEGIKTELVKGRKKHYKYVKGKKVYMTEEQYKQGRSKYTGSNSYMKYYKKSDGNGRVYFSEKNPPSPSAKRRAVQNYANASYSWMSE